MQKRDMTRVNSWNGYMRDSERPTYMCPGCKGPTETCQRELGRHGRDMSRQRPLLLSEIRIGLPDLIMGFLISLIKLN